MRIVVRGTNWIGDAMMSIAALRELRRIFPDAEIVLHTRPWAEGIFRDASFVDAVIPHERHGVHLSKPRQANSLSYRFERAYSRVKTPFEQSAQLREYGFDLAVLLPNSFDSALTVLLAGIPKRIGYNKDLRGLLLSDPIPVPEWKNKRHEVFYYLNLIAQAEKRYLGSETVLNNEPDASLEISDERRSSARRQMADAGVDQSKRTVIFGVGSANSRAKRWGTKNYAALNDRLQDELDVNVVLLGSKDEIDESNEVFAQSREKPVIMAGETDLAEAAAILSVADLLVSNDMGLAHIAPAVGTKTAVIFGPTNPVTTRPFSEDAEVLRRDVECSPCMLRDCPIDHRCMTRISVADVFAVCERTLIRSEFAL